MSTPLRTRSSRIPVSAPSRRRLLLAAGGAAAGGFPMIAVAQSPAVLRFQGAWPAQDIFHEYALDYAKKVNDMGGGRIRIEVLSGGAVVKPHELLDAVDKGVLDGCHAVPAYWARKDPAFALFGSGPALGMDANLLLSWMAYGGGQALYEELYARVLHLNVTGLLYGPMPPQPLGWFRKPLGSAAGLKGLRYRVAGLPAELFRQMGAAVQELPYEEIIPAARGGRLDAAALNNPTSDRQLGLPDVYPVCMLGSYHQPAQVFEVLFNKKRFDALPADLRAIARYAGQAASADMSWKAADRYSADYAELRERPGTRFQKTPPDVLRAQLRAWSALAERRSRDHPWFEKIFRSQQAWARRAVGWTLDTDVDRRMAYDHWFARQAPSGGPGQS
ncbi:MAG TPA: TRAP transporter substrate-binding protein [Burkholderiales bacterium]|nr:TRAP transporter substrate-binding protein [Burkholderiales bacterium]